MIKHLTEEELKTINNKSPYIIKQELSKVNIQEELFDDLKEDYELFTNWFIKKQKDNTIVYITEINNVLSSFLLLKLEGLKEDYSKMINPLPPKNRLKISTIKVDYKNKGIGSRYLKIIDLVSKKNNVDEIYITVLEKHNELISFLEKNNYKYYTYQYTNNLKEYVYIKEVR